VPKTDGFNAVDEAGGSGLIKGEKIKFSNAGEWLNGDTVIAADREFIVIKLLKATQKWSDAKPVETMIIADDAYFPDIETLNAEAPPEEKHEAFGKTVGPWQNVIITYLICPASMEAFCWPTSTMGGFRAIQELKDATRRARMLRGDNLFPRVTLGDKFMNTVYGGRQRPFFVIKGFEPIGDAPPPALTKPAPDSNSDMGGDSIPH
jgi:hypothetical protein